MCKNLFPSNSVSYKEMKNISCFVGFLCCMFVQQFKVIK